MPQTKQKLSWDREDMIERLINVVKKNNDCKLGVLYATTGREDVWWEDNYWTHFSSFGFINSKYELEQ